MSYPTTRLYSTTEESKTAASTDKDKDVFSPPENAVERNENLEDILVEGMPRLEFLPDNGGDDEEGEWKKNFVMVGANRDMMEQDKIMRLVTSEVRVWRELRKKEANPGIPLDVVIERTWDTMEDIFVHLRRKAYESGAAVLTPEEDVTRKTVVILGSGRSDGWICTVFFVLHQC